MTSQCTSLFSRPPPGGSQGQGAQRTCVMRNLVRRSGSRPFSLDRIISNMSPCSFSITTNTFSGVSNMHSRFTIPGCRRLCPGMREEGSGLRISMARGGKHLERSLHENSQGGPGREESIAGSLGKQQAALLWFLFDFLLQVLVRARLSVLPLIPSLRDLPMAPVLESPLVSFYPPPWSHFFHGSRVPCHLHRLVLVPLCSEHPSVLTCTSSLVGSLT